MTYRKLFDPDQGGAQPFHEKRASRLGDRPPKAERHYVFDEEIVLAVNVALAAGRPLLVRGRPGTGKSSMARRVAELYHWRYYAVTVSSRTAARDLQWTFDAVARLADAQAEQLQDRSAYVKPGVLWWAFDPESAARRGLKKEQAEELEAAGKFTPAIDPSPEGRDGRAVVLIDEIDKADPDVPNDLLVPLGSFEFEAEDGQLVSADQLPLVIITTNEERDLPQAFLRRCVILALHHPKPERLREIVRTHYPGVDDQFLDKLLAEYQRVRDGRKAAGLPQPNVAELIDAVAASENLKEEPAKSVALDLLRPLLLEKQTAIPEED